MFFGKVSLIIVSRSFKRSLSWTSKAIEEIFKVDFFDFLLFGPCSFAGIEEAKRGP
jgi:hypothetical protein